MIPLNNDGDFRGVNTERELRVFSSPSWCLVRTIYESELTLQVWQATWEGFFVPSRDHPSTCFASFPVATVQGIPGHGSKHVFCLGGIHNKKPICFTDFNGVCRRSSNLFQHGSRNVSQTLGIPKKHPAGMWAWIIMSHQAFHQGEFLEASEDKNWEQRICSGHVKWWHDTEQMFGLMQDVSVWDGIPNRIFLC